jgi:hypothetical protein
MSNLAQFFQFLYIAGVKVGIWHLGRVEKYQWTIEEMSCIFRKYCSANVFLEFEFFKCLNCDQIANLLNF